MNEIVGGTIELLDEKLARAWLDWIGGSQAAPRTIAKPAWLLAHCESGVTWGRFQDERWHLGSEAFPDLCPRPAQATLLEIRIFSQPEEILIWKTGTSLHGRILRDAASINHDDPCRPENESRLLLAGRVIDNSDGFSRVGNGIGAEQALPLAVAEPPDPWPRLVVRHYFARDERTGAVRVIATRLVEIR